MAASSADVASVLDSIEMNEERFIGLLGKLIGEAEHVQNAPPDFIPREDAVGDHVMAALEPFTTANGGPLVVERVSFAEGRGNIIVKYPGTSDTATVGFVGCHMDVVPANPETWDFNPFELTRDESGEKLRGRGTTDCLGHVAAVTEFFLNLGEKKPVLVPTVAAVFIVSEEASSQEGVGVEGLMEAGKLDFLKGGPIFWVDSADSEPCVGTAGAITWTLKAEGKLFHSGLPHRGINSLELAMEAVTTIQKRFYEDFPPKEEEKEYAFATPSTMKPTQWDCHKNGLNQICPYCTVSGDIRVTPFNDNAAIKKAVEGYVADLNARMAELPTRGPVSKFTLPPAEGEDESKADRGVVSITWGGHEMEGVACDLKSPGFFALRDSIKEARGTATPFSITGSLPLVADLRRAGFDLQICGFGLSSTYHANNEYALLADLKSCVKVCAGICKRLNGGTKAAAAAAAGGDEE